MTAISPYAAEHETAVAEFNERLRRRGAPLALRPAAPAPHERAWSAFVAVDTDGGTGRSTVRGGYVAVRHPFHVHGNDVDIHHVKFPLAESVVDAKFNAVGVQLVVDAQRRFPLSFVLGMGGRRSALARMLETLGWTLIDVRFFFHVVHPSRVARHAAVGRTGRAPRLLLDLVAASGLGAAVLPVHAWRARGASRLRDVEAHEMFDWNDGVVGRVWGEARSHVAFVARRDAARLRELYPPADRRPIRLRIDRTGGPVGWALLLDSQLARHKQFGDMRVGSIVDGFALPGEEASVVRAATRVLRRRGVDLIVSNQSAPRWCAAMLANGWLEGPSNYALGLSKTLAAHVGSGAALHVTRGDGDGPINL
jgi:hypothetical protein